MLILDILVFGYFFGYYKKFFGYFWLLLGVSSATWLRHHLATLLLGTVNLNCGTLSMFIVKIFYSGIHPSRHHSRRQPSSSQVSHPGNPSGRNSRCSDQPVPASWRTSACRQQQRLRRRRCRFRRRRRRQLARDVRRRRGVAMEIQNRLHFQIGP